MARTTSHSCIWYFKLTMDPAICFLESPNLGSFCEQIASGLTEYESEIQLFVPDILLPKITSRCHLSKNMTVASINKLHRMKIFSYASTDQVNSHVYSALVNQNCSTTFALYNLHSTDQKWDSGSLIEACKTIYLLTKLAQTRGARVIVRIPCTSGIEPAFVDKNFSLTSKWS